MASSTQGQMYTASDIQDPGSEGDVFNHAISDEHSNSDEYDSTTDGPGDVGALERFIAARSSACRPSTLNPNVYLKVPVVIPQRQPGNRGRGFIEAYAPDLEQFGIGQAEFIEFIKATNGTLQASKWIYAVQLAAFGTSFIGNSVAMGASVGVQVVASVIAIAETRWKFNSLLDRVNEEFFQPRGLYCLLMAYKPLGASAGSTDTKTEPIQVPPPSEHHAHNLAGRVKKNLRNPVVGTAEGEEGLPPNVAPLLYPDPAESTSAKPRKRDVLSKVNRYLDDRAQARYAKESKGDVLSNPSPPKFKHRYLDPNHPATNSGLLGLISGGRLAPDQEKFQQQMQSAFDSQSQTMQEQREAVMKSLRQQVDSLNMSQEDKQAYIKQYEDAFELQDSQMKQQRHAVKTGLYQRRIVQNVLYLMIVQTPDDAQIAEAKRRLEASDGASVTEDVSMKVVQA